MAIRDYQSGNSELKHFGVQYCQFHCEWFLQISKGEKSKSIPPSDKADSLGVRLELMKEGQHHRNESADWSELLRSLYLCRILTPTKFRR